MPDREGSDARHTAACTIQNTPPAGPHAPIWDERGAKMCKLKEGSGAVCLLLVRVAPQPLCDWHVPKTKHC